MARERKCVLCETVHASKQEMDEHMRSMLHHRELEKLKGRDCGHECRVCKVTLVSLTEYASHISSPTHKKAVEAVEQRPSRNVSEDYFDQTLVDLIEKRKEQIRKDKEAAAAKLAAEEAERRQKEAFQQRLKEAKERYRMECSWKQPSNRCNKPNQHSAWYGSNGYNARPAEAGPWYHNQQGKSATWHAQEPPNFQKWASGDLSGGSLHSQDQWNKNKSDPAAYPGNNQSRLPWLSNGEGRYGLYGQNNISQYTQRSRPLSLLGPPVSSPVPCVFAQALNQFQNSDDNQRGKQGGGIQNGEAQTADSGQSGTKGSKTFGSNPKLDKACRWSPYQVTKSLDSVPHTDSNHNTPDKNSKGPTPQTHKQPESSASYRLSRPEQKAGKTLGLQSGEEKSKCKLNPKSKPKDNSSSSSSSSSSRSSSSQRDDHQKSSSPSKEKANTSRLKKDLKTSSVPCLTSGAQLSKLSNQTHAQSKPTTKQTGPQDAKALPAGLLQSRQEQQLPEKKARKIVLKKRGSLDSSSKSLLEPAQRHLEDSAPSQVGVNKENSCRQNAPEAVRLEKPALPSLDSTQFLQSFQVTTSTVERSEPDAPNREEEKGKAGEKDVCSSARGEAVQAAVAGQSSESDMSRSGEAQGVSGSSSLFKLDLLPALKRDLTKHIASKNKTGSHEPNLNIARRVRNVSESRKSDPEKDSGLKPTVRQLISFSGSRRNVNWDQVYQEVRKKQDKGKGMPRFGIEMVPYDQEEHSQEEGDIPLLEGFQWDSLMDVSSPSATRKRSLSESSVAPAAIHSLFALREGPSSEQQASPESPTLAQENPTSHCQKEAELGRLEIKAEKQPDQLMSASEKALQRSDSLLGEISSGTEQPDGQGTGKRRRAAGDVPSVETSGLEHNSKRRKVKSKKERLQIDQLLAVSLREEELSRSLQTVDTSLIQARAALEAAYMEVQRLMVVKQQMNAEMSTLRNTRIELLKGMQGSMEDVPQIKLKEEKTDSQETPHVSASCPPVTEPAAAAAATAAAATAAAATAAAATAAAAAAAAPTPSTNSPAQQSSPSSSSLAFKPVVIKEEPRSPVLVSSEMDAVDNMTPFAHSTTPELPTAAAATSATDTAPDFQQHSEKLSKFSEKDPMWDMFKEPEDCKESLYGLVKTTKKALQSTKICSMPDSKSPVKSLLSSGRGSEAGSVVDCADSQSFEAPSVPSTFNLPGSPSELRSGKRVRKLKKRKVLKKAQGTEQPESSDTEMEGEASRLRWPRPRRRPSGGSQVSTSTLPTEGGDDMNMEGSEQPVNTQFLNVKLEPGEFPQVASTEPTLNFGSEETMEVTAACHQPRPQAFPPSLLPDSSGPEPLRLAFNEVTSTSDMDICKSSESEMPFPITLPTKTSSDASSDHGEDEIPTQGVFEGHQEAVNAMQIHNGRLYTCSGDRTVKAFDLVSHKCVAVFEGHSSKVSCLLVSAAPFLHHRLYSGSRDQTIRCYSLKTQELELQFSLPDRVLCFHSRWKLLYAGLANGEVVTINLKTNKQMDVFECHGPRAVSCLASSQEGARRLLLVGSFDSTITVRDAKNGLLLRTLEGHTKTVLCMKVVNDLVFSGSSDQCVHAHNIHTGELVRVYKGHSHAVSVVTVLGKVMVTACLDKMVRVYDLQTHNQLQVYGGHKDMVMCMTIHKNMIYTGCYDGSVQAVKLNLMQSYCCWWHGCSMVFALREHLQQHLINNHTSPSLQTLKCRWKNCEEFFSARNSSKQGMLLHIQKHAEEETEVEP